MSSSLQAQFVEAIRNCQELADHLDESQISGVRESTFDESYLEFLELQVELNARGDEWSERLRRRRIGVAKLVNRTHIDGRMRSGAEDYWIKADPDGGQVVYLEVYEDQYSDD